MKVGKPRTLVCAELQLYRPIVSVRGAGLVSLHGSELVDVMCLGDKRGVGGWSKACQVLASIGTE